MSAVIVIEAAATYLGARPFTQAGRLEKVFCVDAPGQPRPSHARLVIETQQRVAGHLLRVRLAKTEVLEDLGRQAAPAVVLPIYVTVSRGCV
jgi:hypothetical protein